MVWSAAAASLFAICCMLLLHAAAAAFTLITTNTTTTLCNARTTTNSHGLEMRAVVGAAHEVSAALEGDLSTAMELVDAGWVWGGGLGWGLGLDSDWLLGRMHGKGDWREVH